MGKGDSLSRPSAEEKSGMDAHFFNKQQLMYLQNDDVWKQEDAENVELKGIDMTIWEKMTTLGTPAATQLACATAAS